MSQADQSNLELGVFRCALSQVVTPEPHFAAVAESAREVPLKVFAVADNARYECSVSAITFRPTMMYQARSFSFTLKNTSTAKLEFAWAVHTMDGDKLPSPDPEAGIVVSPLTNPYTVSPLSGVIEAGQSVQVQFRALPQGDSWLTR